MTNRTVQIYGYGFGPSDANITVTLDGNTVFDGTVPTENAPAPVLSENSISSVKIVPICSFELPVDFQGTIPMSCKVNNGTVIFAEIVANYVKIPNPVFSLEEITAYYTEPVNKQERYNILAAHAEPPFTQDETNALMNDATPFDSPEKVSILYTHGVLPKTSSPTIFRRIYNKEPRSNVTIDGVLQPQDSNRMITYWWSVGEGSTLTYDLNVDAGLVIA